jgi:rhodanese-related sulfurtransferase
MKKLSILFTLLLFVSYTGIVSCGQSSGYKTVDAAEFKKAVDAKEGIVLDVRTPEEFTEGHIPGAMNVDYNGSDFKDKIAQLDKNQKYNVYCRSGKRSAASSQILVESGFKNVVNLNGGIMAWQAGNYPVEK